MRYPLYPSVRDFLTQPASPHSLAQGLLHCDDVGVLLQELLLTEGGWVHGVAENHHRRLVPQELAVCNISNITDDKCMVDWTTLTNIKR